MKKEQKGAFMFSDKTKSYTVTFPNECCGALMRIISPEHPEVAFVEKYQQCVKSHEYFPASIGLSIPCGKDFNFMMGPPHWHDCGLTDIVHGHVLVSGDDGTALLPYTLFSQNDLKQVLDDLRQSNLLGPYFNGTREWLRAVEYIFANDPVAQLLPEDHVRKAKSYDLSNTVWSM